MWKYRGQKRPDFAETPGPGQESVWNYPRPPRLVPDYRLIEIFSGDEKLARSNNTYRVLETASPPSFYSPPADVRWEQLQVAPGRSVCEWKGVATYWTLSADPDIGPIGWSYSDPLPPFLPIRNYIAFYPAAVACFTDGERVRPQPGKFYGGWVTSEIAGPFKGEPGSASW
jgi:uncharacterized protein (DUF427 family)